MKHTTITLAVIAALCAGGGFAQAQETGMETTPETDTRQTDAQEP